MECHVVLARCSVIVVIDDGMPFITIVSIFSDRRTPPIAERQQQRALLLVAYLSSVHTVVFVFRVFIVDDSCNTSASIVDHHRPEREREHATQDTARLSNTSRFIAIMANEMSTYPCILVIGMSRAIAFCSPIYQVTMLIPVRVVDPRDPWMLSCLRLVNQLGIDQMAQRRRWAMNSDEQRRPIWEYDDSRELSITPSDVQTLADRLRVNRSIVTFNAHRLRSVCFELLELHETFRRTMTNHSENNVFQPSSTLMSDQMAMTLEFFLQMDCTLSL